MLVRPTPAATVHPGQEKWLHPAGPISPPAQGIRAGYETGELSYFYTFPFTTLLCSLFSDMHT